MLFLFLLPDKPSKPKGPLKVSDVTAESVKLKWEPPEDDGGEPVDHYVVERMDLDTGRWVPVTESKVSGCQGIPLSFVSTQFCFVCLTFLLLFTEMIVLGFCIFDYFSSVCQFFVFNV